MDGERREIKSIGKFQKEVCTYRGEKERGGIGFVYKSRQCGVLGVYMSNLDTGHWGPGGLSRGNIPERGIHGLRAQSH